MKKRDFIKTGAVLALGSLAAPVLLESCNNNNPVKNDENIKKSSEPIVYELPKLEFAFDELEPHIDAQTMEIHHGKHHGGYVKKLNKALENHEWAAKDLKGIFAGLRDEEQFNAIRNNGGGHFNHTLFWKTIGPDAGGEPKSKLLSAINSDFGSFENFKNQFVDAAAKVFGSGWAWLSLGSDKKLFISTTSNQDNPLMKNLVENPGIPVLGLDVWEHAYYLKYQNKRKDYLMAFFNVVRWDRVAEEYDNALKS